MDKAILLNIGNSNSEIAFWNRGDILSLHQVETNSLTKAIFASEIFQREQETCFLAACVVPAVKEVLLKEFSERSIIWLSTELPLGLDLTLIEKSTIGADRLANAVAAINSLDLPAIILDCGTAITTEVIDANKRLLGGMIAPGRGLARWALHQGTGQLPKVELSQDLPIAIGCDTIQAIKSGVDLGVLGAVEKILDKSRELIGYPDLEAVVIGGDRDFFAKHLSKAILGPDNFTLQGIANVAGLL